MKKLINYFFMIIAIIVIAGTVSCSNKTAKTDETDIKSMDSVTTVLEESNKELEKEVKKLEASLEKIENETDTTK